ncbi:ComF family protein [Deinococcus maricopensis]|uniref:ComF family protein n=1 Tax=Deinococcus maricopensis TaxID=309887 RepID=UPI0002D56682
MALLHAQVSAHSPLTREVTPHLVSLGTYRGVVRRAVRDLKYAGARDVSVPLGVALARGVPPAWAVEVVTSVPMPRAREAERGFNQSALLGRVIARELGVPYLPLLARTSAQAGQQAKVSGSERRAHLAGAFRAVATPPARVLLVDDVLTSGTTLAECAAALTAAGAQEIRFAVVAR